jgi:ATPase subunit of ABC transporter with duplicated ATPase domains
MSEDYFRMAQKVHIERDDPTLSLKFPNPMFPPGLALEHSPLVRMEDVSFGYKADERFLLQDVTLHLARVALVGVNGSGKTSLVKLITGELDKTGKRKGELWRHPSLRIGHVSQYAVEELESFVKMTVVQYAEEQLASGRTSSRVIGEASGNVRQYLGAFGLGGAHAHRTIGSLSGGERMRLCFATVLADEPQLLLLDESTNHVDLETLDSLSEALNAYQGAVLMVSHNQGFLSGFCKELWVVEDGLLEISHDDTESFDELFSNYRSHILSGSSARVRTQQRQAKAGMARRAAKQSANTRGNATLLA